MPPHNTLHYEKTNGLVFLYEAAGRRFDVRGRAEREYSIIITMGVGIFSLGGRI